MVLIDEGRATLARMQFTACTEVGAMVRHFGGHYPLGGTELANAQVGTIRLKLLKIGARVVCSVRRVMIHLAAGYPLKDLFAGLLTRLSELSVKSPAFG